MRGLRWLLWLGVLTAASTAQAELRLGVGAHDWVDVSPVFDIDVAGSTSVARHLEVGVRGGAAIVTSPSKAMIPLDLQLRVVASRLYVEGSAGPWILLDDHPIKAHGAIGLGLRAGDLEVGAELGWLDPDPILGIHFALRL